jgi:hypothetical protein
MNDGGYVIDSKSLLSSDALLSLGISDDWSFDSDFRLKNPKVIIHGYDHTISKNIFRFRVIKKFARFFLFKATFKDIINAIETSYDYKKFFNQKNNIHFKKKVSDKISKKETNLEEMIAKIASNSIFLKVDIEGSEWELFTKSGVPTSKLDFLSRVNTLVIEFHGISQISNRNSWQVIEESLETILNHFKPVSISGNNCRPFFQMGGVPLIDVFEVTFIRRTEEFQPPVVKSTNSPRNLPNRAGLMVQSFYSRTNQES